MIITLLVSPKTSIESICRLAKIDSIEVFGLTGKVITIGLILLYGGLAFYFHAVKTEANFLQRILSFSLVTVLVGFVISFFSKVTFPLLHLSTTSLVVGVIACLIFIIMVSHEIVAVFVTVI